MRLLLDESLPRGLKRMLAPHDVKTVPEMGWAGKSNGDLLTRAQVEFAWSEAKPRPMLQVGQA